MNDEIRNFLVEFSKMQAQTHTKKIVESKLKKLETNIKYLKNLKYIKCRNKLGKTCEQKINGVRIRKKRS